MHHINNPVIIQNWAGERSRKNVLLNKPELAWQAGGKVLKLSEFDSGTTHSFSPFSIFPWDLHAISQLPRAVIPIVPEL